MDSSDSPDWLRVGGSVWDQDGERWTIRSIGATKVAVAHPDRGEHRLLRSDLVEWVEDGEWEPIEGGGESA